MQLPRMHWVVAAALCAAPLAHAGTMWRVVARDLESLQTQLIAFSEERLLPAGLHIDQRHARLNLSEQLPDADYFEVWPAESSDDDTLPQRLLVFELRPRRHDSSTAGQPLQATLSVTLSRDVWVAVRRLRKGSIVTCDDMQLQRRRLRDVPGQALMPPCAMKSDAVTLRDVAAGDVIRALDVGAAPAVVEGGPVSVSVAAGAISVTAKAIALADARVGDQIDVRLQRPTRVLRTRVTGPGSVQLLENAP